MAETALFSEFWLIWGAFILFIILVMYALKKAVDFVPTAIKSHFEQIEKNNNKHSEDVRILQTNFTIALADITKENQSIVDSFIQKLWADHSKQNMKLEEIHNDIKILHKQ